MAKSQEQWKLSSAHGHQRTCPRKGALGDPDGVREPWWRRRSCRTCGASSSWWHCCVYNPALPSAHLSQVGLPSPPACRRAVLAVFMPCPCKTSLSWGLSDPSDCQQRFCTCTVLPRHRLALPLLWESLFCNAAWLLQCLELA